MRTITGEFERFKGYLKEVFLNFKALRKTRALKSQKEIWWDPTVEPRKLSVSEAIRGTITLTTFLSIALAGVANPGIVLTEGIILTVLFLLTVISAMFLK